MKTSKLVLGLFLASASTMAFAATPVAPAPENAKAPALVKKPEKKVSAAKKMHFKKHDKSAS